MAQLGKVSPTTAVRAFAKGALSGGGCARAASGGPAKRAVSFLAAYAFGPRNEAGMLLLAQNGGADVHDRMSALGVAAEEIGRAPSVKSDVRDRSGHLCENR